MDHALIWSSWSTRCGPARRLSAAWQVRVSFSGYAGGPYVRATPTAHESRPLPTVWNGPPKVSPIPWKLGFDLLDKVGHGSAVATTFVEAVKPETLHAGSTGIRESPKFRQLGFLVSRVN